MNTNVVEINGQKHFKPSKELINYFKKRLQISKAYTDIEDGIRRGENGGTNK